jgi:hypothetical protein
MKDPTPLPVGALLDRWNALPWDNGIQVDSLDEMDVLIIQTQNSTYEMTVLCPSSREILVRGGRFFPEFTEARLAGSSLGGSFLKLGGIYTDFKMELQAEGRVIVTSRVRTIGIKRTHSPN